MKESYPPRSLLRQVGWRTDRSRHILSTLKKAYDLTWGKFIPWVHWLKVANVIQSKRGIWWEAKKLFREQKGKMEKRQWGIWQTLMGGLCTEPLSSWPPGSCSRLMCHSAQDSDTGKQELVLLKVSGFYALGEGWFPQKKSDVLTR